MAISIWDSCTSARCFDSMVIPGFRTSRYLTPNTLGACSDTSPPCVCLKRSLYVATEQSTAKTNLSSLSPAFDVSGTIIRLFSGCSLSSSTYIIRLAPSYKPSMPAISLKKPSISTSSSVCLFFNHRLKLSVVAASSCVFVSEFTVSASITFIWCFVYVETLTYYLHQLILRL